LLCYLSILICVTPLLVCVCVCVCVCVYLMLLEVVTIN
jgi:hypothetical protein